MAALYEIDRQILDCIDRETGEIIDSAQLDCLQMERAKKIENVALWYKNLQSDAIAFAAEKASFEARQVAAEKKAGALNEWITKALSGQKYASKRVLISFRRSEKVAISNTGTIGQEYLIYPDTTPRPDKAKIKAAIKKGIIINGAQLIKNLTCTIK